VRRHVGRPGGATGEAGSHFRARVSRRLGTGGAGGSRRTGPARTGGERGQGRRRQRLPFEGGEVAGCPPEAVLVDVQEEQLGRRGGLQRGDEVAAHALDEGPVAAGDAVDVALGGVPVAVGDGPHQLPTPGRVGKGRGGQGGG